MTRSTPGLHQLIGAYVNQDVHEIHGDVWAAVEDFIEGSPKHAPLVPSEIDEITSSLDDDELEHYLVHDLGIGFVADAADGGYRGWLAQVARRVAAAAGTN